MMSAPQSRVGASSPAVREACILAIDHGERRIGLAIKPKGQDWAIPTSIVEAASESDAIDSIRSIIQSRDVDTVVIGLPVNESPHQARLVKRFARRLRVGFRYPSGGVCSS